MPSREKPRARLARGLKTLRKASGLSVNEAVDALRKRGITVGERYLRQWESLSDVREPFASDLYDIAETYKCRIQDLFLEEK